MPKPINLLWSFLIVFCGALGIPLLDRSELTSAVDFKIIQSINRDQSVTWLADPSPPPCDKGWGRLRLNSIFRHSRVAGQNEIFEGLTLDQVRRWYVGWHGPEAEDSTAGVIVN